MMEQLFSSEKGTPRAIMLVWGAIILLALMARLVPQPRTVDDAFITFRYSRNLVNGDGFVYNLDSRVLGTTTPLYTFTMAGFGLVFGDNDYPSYAMAVNAVADAISTFLLMLLAFRLSKNQWVAAATGLLWAILPFSVTFAIGGMETSVHNLWMIAAWTAYVYQWRSGWVGAFVALGILTRPDAAIWAGPLLLHQLFVAWRERGGQPLLKWIPWQAWGVGLAIGLPWTIFATVYFGSPIPHTVGTKAAVYQVDGLQAFLRLLQHYATLLHQHELLGALAGVAIGLIVFPTLAIIGSLSVLRENGRSLSLVVYPWLYFAVFSILNPLIFRWYLAPPLPAYLLTVTIGAYAVLNAALPNISRQRWVGAGWTAFACVCLLNAWQLKPDHAPSAPAPRMAFHELELNYAAMAQRLVEHEDVNENTLIAIGDIGAFGFYSNARILDTIGLVTKDLDAYYDPDRQAAIIAKGANYAIPPDMIFDYQPQYLVVMADFVELGLLEDPRFAQYYDPEPLYTIETDYYGGYMWVFVQRTSP